MKATTKQIQKIVMHCGVTGRRGYKSPHLLSATYGPF